MTKTIVVDITKTAHRPVLNFLVDFQVFPLSISLIQFFLNEKIASAPLYQNYIFLSIKP